MSTDRVISIIALVVAIIALVPGIVQGIDILRSWGKEVQIVQFSLKPSDTDDAGLLGTYSFTGSIVLANDSRNTESIFDFMCRLTSWRNREYREWVDYDVDWKKEISYGPVCQVDHDFDEIPLVIQPGHSVRVGISVPVYPSRDIARAMRELSSNGHSFSTAKIANYLSSVAKTDPLDPAPLSDDTYESLISEAGELAATSNLVSSGHTITVADDPPRPQNGEGVAFFASTLGSRAENDGLPILLGFGTFHFGGAF